MGAEPLQQGRLGKPFAPDRGTIFQQDIEIITRVESPAR